MNSVNNIYKGVYNGSNIAQQYRQAPNTNVDYFNSQKIAAEDNMNKLLASKYGQNYTGDYNNVDMTGWSQQDTLSYKKYLNDINMANDGILQANNFAQQKNQANVQQAAINQMAQNYVGQNMAQQGMSGTGASESTVAGISTNYANNVNANNLEEANNLSQLYRDYYSQQNDINQSYIDNMQEANQKDEEEKASALLQATDVETLQDKLNLYYGMNLNELNDNNIQGVLDKLPTPELKDEVKTMYKEFTKLPDDVETLNNRVVSLDTDVLDIAPINNFGNKNWGAQALNISMGSVLPATAMFTSLFNYGSNVAHKKQNTELLNKLKSGNYNDCYVGFKTNETFSGHKYYYLHNGMLYEVKKSNVDKNNLVTYNKN